jgi:hypothetical protein
MPSYVARPHVLANKFVPGYLGDSFGLLPFVHGNPLANHFDGPFLVRLIRKEVPNMSGFPFGIEGRDPDIPSCWHSGTMRRSCCWSIPATIKLTRALVPAVAIDGKLAECCTGRGIKCAGIARGRSWGRPSTPVLMIGKLAALTASSFEAYSRYLSVASSSRVASFPIFTETPG